MEECNRMLQYCIIRRILWKRSMPLYYPNLRLTEDHEESHPGKPSIRPRYEPHIYGLKARKFTAATTWWNMSESLPIRQSVYLYVRRTLFPQNDVIVRKNDEDLFLSESQPQENCWFCCYICGLESKFCFKLEMKDSYCDLSDTKYIIFTLRHDGWKPDWWSRSRRPLLSNDSEITLPLQRIETNESLPGSKL
jgi:hypothetical protein